MEYKVDDRYDTDLGLHICYELNIDVKNKLNGRIMTSHKDHGTKTACMQIDLDNNWYKCYSCGEKGTITGLYYEEIGTSAYKAFGRNSINTDYTLNNFKNFRSNEVDLSIPPITSFESNMTLVPISDAKLGLKFLEDRGLSNKNLDLLRMQYCIKGFTETKNDRPIYFNKRAIIPIYEKNRLITIEGRDIEGKHVWESNLIKNNFDPSKYEYKKVLYPKGSSSNTIWRWERLDYDKDLFLVEGTIDAISLMECETTYNASAMFHAIPSERQLFLLKKFKNIVYIPDNDITGIKTIKFFQKRNISNISVLMLPRLTNIKDVNDIQKGKSSRYKNVEALIDAGWLNNITPLRDINTSLLDAI